MKRFLFSIKLLMVISIGFSQTSKFGKISDDQFKLMQCTIDTASSIVILFDAGSISIKGDDNVVNKDPECKLQRDFFPLFFERHLRIKVLKSINDSTILHSFILRSREGKSDKLSYFKGISIYHNLGKTVETKFNVKNLTKNLSDDGNVIYSYDLPFMKEGTIIDIEYGIVTNILEETPEWNFSDRFPNLYSEITFIAPDFFKFQKICKILNKLEYTTFKEPSILGVIYPPQNSTKYLSYSFYEIHEKYILKNIPKVNEQNNSDKLKYLTNSIDFKSVNFRSGASLRL